MSEELKPCPNPWCDKSNRQFLRWELYSRQVACTCGVKGPHSKTTTRTDLALVDKADAEAITAWNTRSDLALAAQGALLEKIASWHDELANHDQSGLVYSSLVGIPISNADELDLSVRTHEWCATETRSLSPDATAALAERERLAFNKGWQASYEAFKQAFGAEVTEAKLDQMADEIWRTGNLLITTEGEG